MPQTLVPLSTFRIIASLPVESRGGLANQPMTQRRKPPETTQAEILIQSRRRCCVCFGLSRDDAIKKGQIAHLDRNRDNNDPSNLAFLCLEHHDEYDSRTSQSKGLSRLEIQRYRDELTSNYGGWSAVFKQQELLNFLAFQADLPAMAATAVKAGLSVTCFGEDVAFEALIADSMDSCDGDRYVPHLTVLEYFASWGWCTFASEERAADDDLPRVFITVQRRPVCDRVAEQILRSKSERGESIESLMRTAEFVGWRRPT